MTKYTKNIFKSGGMATATNSFSRAKKLTKFCSMKESKIYKSNTKYSNHVGTSFKAGEKSRRYSMDDNKKNKTHKDRLSNLENSVHFVKPLKTSTVVSLNELKRNNRDKENSSK